MYAGKEGQCVCEMMKVDLHTVWPDRFVVGETMLDHFTDKW